MNRLGYFGVCLVLFFGCALAYPRGAPRDICGRYIPGHPNSATPVANGVQSGSFVVEVAAGQGQSLTVTLRGANNNQFKGFLIQAMPSWKNLPENSADILGQFQQDTTGQSQLRSCGSLTGATVLTHTNPQWKPSISTTWRAPPNLQGRVKFVATVVRDLNNFYVVNSTEISVQDMVSQGTTQGGNQVGTAQSSGAIGQGQGTNIQGQGQNMVPTLNVQPLEPPPSFTPAPVGLTGMGFPNQGQRGNFFGQAGQFGQGARFPGFGGQAGIGNGFTNQVTTFPGGQTPRTIRVPLGSTLEQELMRLGQNPRGFRQPGAFGGQFGQGARFGQGGQFGQPQGGQFGQPQGGQFGQQQGGRFGQQQGGQFGQQQGGQGGQTVQGGQPPQGGQFGQGGLIGQGGQTGQTGQFGFFGQGGQIGQGMPFGQGGQFGQGTQGGQFGQGFRFGQGRPFGQPGPFGQVGPVGQGGFIGQGGQGGFFGQTNPAVNTFGQGGQLVQTAAGATGQTATIGQGGQGQQGAGTTGQGGQVGQGGTAGFGQFGQTGQGNGLIAPGQQFGGQAPGRFGQFGQGGPQFFGQNSFPARPGGFGIGPVRGGLEVFNGRQFRPLTPGQLGSGQFGAAQLGAGQLGVRPLGAGAGQLGAQAIPQGNAQWFAGGQGQRQQNTQGQAETTAANGQQTPAQGQP